MSLHLSKTSTTKLPPPQITTPTIHSTTHLDRVSYLFGHPISHSLSPLLHSTIYTHHTINLNYEQHLYETTSLTSCIPLMSTPKFFGASVTMPFKVSIIPYLDELTPEAEAIGAVNTVFLLPSNTEENREGEGEQKEGKGRLGGHNTDCVGIRDAILMNTEASVISDMRGKPGMVIGGGGTSRAAIYALKRFLGCSTVYLVNREKKEVDQVIAECKSRGFGESLVWVGSIDHVEAIEARRQLPTVVVSAIPDVEPRSWEEVRTRNVVEAILKRRIGDEKKSVLLEMCYSEGPDTAIAVAARRWGWCTVEGTEAMIWQGLEQDRVWLGREVSELPVERVKEVIWGRVRKNVEARPRL